MIGGRDVYVTKIATVWTVTGIEQLLNVCYAVENKIRVIIGQSDLYVIPEDLLYEIFSGIHSSTPGLNE